MSARRHDTLRQVAGLWHAQFPTVSAPDLRALLADRDALQDSLDALGAVLRGVRVEGETVVVTVKGGNVAARWLCGELVKLFPVGKGEVSDEAKALAYYRAAVDGRHPEWVPARVLLRKEVRGDPPLGHQAVAAAGEHDCDSNAWGAVSVRAANGELLGIKPKEFEPIAWRRATAKATGGAL